MVRIGTPKNINEYIKFDYEISSKIQMDGIIPIWRDDNFMYFEKTNKFIKYVRKEKLIYGEVD